MYSLSAEDKKFIRRFGVLTNVQGDPKVFEPDNLFTKPQPVTFFYGDILRQRFIHPSRATRAIKTKHALFGSHCTVL